MKEQNMEIKYKAYIAGALNADAVGYIKNMHNMIMWSERVRKLGVAVFVPCLDIVSAMIFGDWEYNDFFDNSQPWMLSADFCFICPNWENSSGTKSELRSCVNATIPVYFSIHHLARDIKNGKLQGDVTGIIDDFVYYISDPTGEVVKTSLT